MTQEIKVGKKTIFFDDEAHRFTDAQGNKVQSVTYYTGVIDKSSALIGWAVKLYRQYLESKLESGAVITGEEIAEGAKQHRIKKEEAADIGTRVHELVNKWIKTKKSDLAEDEDEKVINGFQAFLKFQAEHKFKWLESEKVVYSPKHNYAGVLDAVALDGEKRKVLVDFKSTNGLYNEYAFQAAAYQQAFEEMTKQKLAYRIVIKFGKETGDFEFREYHDNKKDIDTFLACKRIKDRLGEMEK
jgi:hypothetical protein